MRLKELKRQADILWNRLLLAGGEGHRATPEQIAEAEDLSRAAEALFRRPPAAERHWVTCAACAAQVTVPFRPASARPVFCSPCYRRERASQPAAAVG